MDMENCKKQGFVKNIRLDSNKIEALQKTAKRKKEAFEALPDKFHETKFTLLYDVLRIILEYLALKEAGTMVGKPYLVQHRFSEAADPVIMLNAAPKTKVKYFLNKFAEKKNLNNTFGSPSRGYAGGTIDLTD